MVPMGVSFADGIENGVKGLWDEVGGPGSVSGNGDERLSWVVLYLL